ncbi:MAG: NHL repeat-containing protein [Candidatus Polarisedimenticolia bacterium]
MTRRRAGAPGAAVACLLMLAPCPDAAAAEPAGGGRYLRTLRLPESADPLRQPLAVHADLHTGEIFACDRARDRIAVFDAAGLFRAQIRGGRIFRTPLDLAVDPEGFIVLLAYREESTVLLLLDFDGAFVRAIRLTGLPGDAREPQPLSVALAPSGDRLYVLDQANLRVWIADRDGTIAGSIDLAAGLGEKEKADLILGRVDVYGDTVLVPLPMAGSVLLAGLDGRVRGVVGVKGTGRCQTAFPVAAAIDAAGHLLMLDQQRTLITIWNPADGRCLGEFSGIGSLPGFLYQPADLALDRAGRIYVSQGFEGRVQVFGGDAPAAGTAPPGGGTGAPEEVRPD